jgi:cytochrome c-type biogenesis protein CcmH
MTRRALMLVTALLIVLPALTPSAAQEVTPEPQPTRVVTQDEVNEVAAQMYCPVCEYIPLDTCGEVTCIEWRRQIREQLEQGASEDEIIADFVARFGQQVVGVPQDEGLRWLSFIGPLAFGAISLVVAGVLLFNWRRGGQVTVISAPSNNNPPDAGASSSSAGYETHYRDQIERDLN